MMVLLMVQIPLVHSQSDHGSVLYGDVGSGECTISVSTESARLSRKVSKGDPLEFASEDRLNLDNEY